MDGPSAVNVLILCKGKVLMTKRGPRSVSKGGGPGWTFPGGKVDQGETPKQALVRELYEELGLVVYEEGLRYVCSDVSGDGYIPHFYALDVKESTLNNLKLAHDECAEWKLFSMTDRPQIPFECHARTWTKVWE